MQNIHCILLYAYIFALFVQWMYHFFIVIILSAFRPPEPEDPCEPNPCGPNSNPPYARGTQCQCTCQPQMIGSPPNCRPECVINNDCPSDKACINRKCEDPCPGLCGTNAYCRVRNHIPICVCNRGFNGDPFSRCNRVTSKSMQLKYVFIFIKGTSHFFETLSVESVHGTSNSQIYAFFIINCFQVEKMHLYTSTHGSIS